ncbi:TNF receptor-associated factor 5-like [Halichondria panicea]|uniref:TNF receptor-associated factor 5-like n=1 Tax=Halichondria panicea TaxID=6063 RepID=UPI00312B9F09
MATSNYSSTYSGEVPNDYSDEEIAVPSTDYSDEEIAVPSTGYSDEEIAVPSTGYSDEEIAVPSTGYSDEEIAVPSTDYSDEEIAVPSTDYSDEEIAVPSTGYCEDIAVPSTSYSDEEIAVPSTDCSDEEIAVPSTDYSDEDIAVPSTSYSDEETAVPKEIAVPSTGYCEEIAVPSTSYSDEETAVSEEIAVPSTGYLEYGYIFVHPLPEKYICGICKNILSQPRVTECCGQHFCEDCLKKSASQNTIQHWSTQSRLRLNRHSTHHRQYVKPQTSTCPHCRQNNFNHIRYLPFKREIDSMKVHCPRKSSGCNVHVAYGNREDHDKTCGYIRVVCTNKCGKTVFKKDLQSHTRNNCTLRRVTCKACGKIGTYKDIESLGHNSVCPEVWVKCGNSCGARFKRKATRSHDLVCLEATVNCQFAEAGCTVKPKRKDLESHLDANMKQHLSQLMTAHVKIKQEFQAFKESHEEKDHPFSTAPLKMRGWH